jgi:hypothetical protein
MSQPVVEPTTIPVATTNEDTVLHSFPTRVIAMPSLRTKLILPKPNEPPANPMSVLVGWMNSKACSKVYRVADCGSGIPYVEAVCTLYPDIASYLQCKISRGPNSKLRTKTNLSLALKALGVAKVPDWVDLESMANEDPKENWKVLSAFYDLVLTISTRVKSTASPQRLPEPDGTPEPQAPLARVLSELEAVDANRCAAPGAKRPSAWPTPSQPLLIPSGLLQPASTIDKAAALRNVEDPSRAQSLNWEVEMTLGDSLFMSGAVLQGQSTDEASGNAA